jgi:tetratricopeptide (TPR) repeat protein
VAPDAAVPRQTTSAALRKQLTGDLDSILLKALEVDRERRYDSVISFAADLERYLAGQPVAAIQPTLSYRTKKFVQRHRVQVAAAAMVVTAITGGAIAGGVGFVRARRAEAAARQEAATAREVSHFLTRLFAISDPNAARGSPATVQDVLQAGTRRVRSDLKSAPEVRAALLGTLSHVHASLGSYKQAKELAELSLAAEPARADLRTAAVLVDLGRISQDLGQFDDARKALHRALDIRLRELGSEHLDVSAVLNLLGGLEGQLENFENAIAFHRRALAIQEKTAGPNHIATYNSWRGMGMLYDRQGNPKAARECFERVLPIARARYGEVHPIVGDALNNLGMVYYELDQFAKSRKAYEESLAIRRKTLGSDHPSVAFTAHGLAKLMQHEGKLDEAARMLEEAIRIRTSALGANNLRTGESLKALGLLRIAMGQIEEAKRLLGESLRILQSAYGVTHSDTLRIHRDAALAFVKAGRVPDALPHLREVATTEVPERVRLNLDDPVFDPIRGRRDFQNLAKDLRRP